MLAKFALAASALVTLASADVVPTGPTPGDTFREGGNCLVQYDVDTTGTWTNTTIQLMSGSNLAMVVVADVVTGLDGSTGGVINWDCPAVEPNSEIYFYQFSNPGEQTSWTGRFTIAGADGSTTEPTNSTTTGGTTIQFGYGALENPNEAIGQPTISGGVIASGGAASGSATGSRMATAVASSASASVISSASSAVATAASSASSAAQSAVSTAESSSPSSSSSSQSSTSNSASQTSASQAAASSQPASGASSLAVKGGLLSALLVGAVVLA